MHDLRERDERGASAVEYGLIAFAVAALIAVSVFLLGGVVNDMFGSSCSTFANEANANAVASTSC